LPDGAAFDAFFRENFARIVRASALVTLDGSVAEDIAAEAFARLWGKWGQIDDDDHAGGFVFKTAMRLCYRELSRRRRRLHRVESGEDQDPARPFLQPELAQALRDLPTRQRQCVVLRDWAGYETAEVARLLGARESTVRVHLMRGRARLREALRVDQGSHS
jgi:RNA polymerase sigma factor (sigma-70 family)